MTLFFQLAAAPSDYLPLTDAVIGPFDSDTPERCFSVVVVTDSVCEGEVDGEGVPRGEVFSAVVRSQEGSDVEVTGSSRVASITIEDSPECSMCVYCSTACCSILQQL